jgi:hypothetical protein
VARGQGQAPPQGTQSREGRSGREHRGPRGDPPLRRLRYDLPGGRAQRRRGALEDPYPGLEQARAEPERQARRLDGRRIGIEGGAAKQGRVAPRADGVAVERLAGLRVAELAAGGKRLGPGVVPGWGGGCLDVAGLAIPGIYLLLGTEAADRIDGVVRGERDGHRVGVAEPAAQRRQAEPEGVAEPAVAPARPVPRDLGLADNHLGLRLESLQVPGCP